MKYLKAKKVFILSIILLLLSSASLFFDHRGFALRLINYSFLLLLVGAVLYILELKKYEKEK